MKLQRNPAVQCMCVVREYLHASPELPPWLRRPKRREIFFAHSVKCGQPFPDLLVPAKSITPVRNTVSALVESRVNESFSLVFVQMWLGERKCRDDST